ncbi:protein tyrosine phosphatase domain-containing protein 1 isoform X1 [Stegostoma tigrinum]|uniref:protein tyrosine phosphatase domain-containing protein 1 isoform X1 n=1 Tax=Stegostoma tigrinum TaxID=3053191 RepID=UPI00202B1091|nr:protein tyrosine phosphatase domain-containing protein 1 isoform X1 [Stegostoma tigrinum]
MTLQIPNPRPSYSQTRELLIKAVPPHLICSLVCGGKECRYEGPGEWTLQQQAIRGVFSAWVTDDILAMARPSTQLIKKFNIIKQFQGLNIKSVINLQVPGEHDHCGDPLELKSGFSYLPETFMENNIYFFNFGMADFGVSSLVRVLDAVKVTSFAIQEGKVAVHCHAGLGRTANQEPEDPDNSLRPPTSAAGLFDQASLPGWDAKAQPRMMPRLLRTVSDSNLPGIISTYQTQGTCTQQPLPMGQRRAAALELVFSGPTNPVKRSFSYEGRENLVRDRNMVQTDHVAGFKLARHGNSLLTNTDLLSTTSTKSNVHWRKSVKESSRKMNKHGHLLEEVARAMSEGSPTDNDFLVKVRLWKMELNENEGAWGRLTAEHDPRVLSMLMWSWLEHLKKPVLCSEDVVTLLSNHAVKGTPWDLEKCQEGTINCILDCISKFTGLPSTLEDSIIHRMILALTQSCEEDVLHFTALLQKLKMIIREKRSHYIFNKGVAKTKMLKISLHGEESK